MGQVIDLLPPSATDNEEAAEGATTGAAASASAGTGTGEEDAVPPEARAQASVAKLRGGLKGLGAGRLLGAFRQAQEDRARAYAAFEEGLARVLRSRDFAAYNGVCAEATARFAALSNLVNAVEAELAGEGGAAGAAAATAGVAGLVRRVQAEEKEKLSLTAALHLERFRLATSSCSGGGGGASGSGEGLDGGGNAGGAAASSSESLLRDGVKMLEGRLGEVKGRINDILEELRYEMADLAGEEGEE